MKIDIKPLGRTLGPMKGIIPRLMVDRLKQEGIIYTFDQMVVLQVVRHCPKAQQEIAEVLQRDKSVILRIVDILEMDGLLYRTTDPADRRRNNINLTDKGFKYSDKFTEIETNMTIELLKGLKEEEIEAFYKVIGHIQKRAEEL